MADLFGRQPEEARAPAQVPLIVEALLNQIRIERPTGQVLVKGRVERLTAWPKSEPRHLFGELVGSERSIEFRCPIDQGPKAVGEHVVLSGTLTIRPSSIHQGFSVQLVGEVVGTWAPDKRAAAPVILERRRGAQAPDRAAWPREPLPDRLGDRPRRRARRLAAAPRRCALARGALQDC